MSELISMDKKYKTRGGLDARVLCIDNYYGDSDFPVIALVEGETSTYTVTGGFYSHKEDDCDLVEVPEEKELWVEIFYVGDGHIRAVYYLSENTLRNGVESNNKFYSEEYKLIATKKITYVEGETCL